MKVTYEIAGCEVPKAVWDAFTRKDQKITKLKIALADAIRRPMGIVPDSAIRDNLVTPIELEEAEKRRPRDPATRPDWYL